MFAGEGAGRFQPDPELSGMLWERRIPQTAPRCRAQPGDALAMGCGQLTPTPGSAEGLNGSDGRCLSCLWDACCRIGRLFLLLF